jgi:uncharacterized protein (TIGR03118 family)
MLTHKFTKSQGAARLLLSALAMLVAATLLSLPADAQRATPKNLTSDIPNVGSFNDTHLVNAWGLSVSPSGPWWVSDNGTGLSTLYIASGAPQGLVVTIPGVGGNPGTPTGTVYNGTSDFKINGTPAVFLFVSDDGNLTGWYTGTSANLVLNTPNADYKGLALASSGGANYLYAANFHNNSVDVFDTNFAPHSFGSSAFQDSTIPTGFAPFNVQNIGGGKLAVTFAKQDANKHDDVPGRGNGYVDIFDTSGNLLTRFNHNIYLNSPWGVAVVPASGFGGFGNDILVGQFGSGAILVYTPAGAFAGILLDPANLQLQIDGLWALAFGNGGAAGPTTTLFFTTGAFGQAHGILGSMTCCSTGP